MSSEKFVPSILVMACNWCTYTGCDQAGRSRLQRAPNVRIIRTMCSGRVEPEFVLRALFQGADGVIVGACHIGDCHYTSGNFKTVRRFALFSNYISQYGFHPQRFQLWHISASEGAEFTHKLQEYVEILTDLGPNKQKQSNSLLVEGSK
jgi:F420-non-reducing hydrogenase iron-sulfur subunit